MRPIIFCIICFSTIVSVSSNAQNLKNKQGDRNKQTIRGRVIDKDSKKPLYSAQIALYKDSVFITGGITDTAGFFKIPNISVGRYVLIVSYLGYRQYNIQSLSITSGKEAVLTIELEESVIGLDNVVVTQSRNRQTINDMITISGRTFTIEETNRYPGSRNDPARMASNYAGVRGADDSRNDIIVRGNSPLGLCWYLEGVEIPNPNHFALFGTTGGSVNILNNKTLANSDFITSAFPAEYGNGIAGIFDIKMRAGNNEKKEFTGQIGFLGVEFLAEGPVEKKKQSSYLISYRYSTLELFQLTGIKFGVSAVPKYQDISVKLHFPTKNGGHFSIFGVGGKSDIAMLDSERKTTDWSFGDGGKNVFFGSNMGVFGANYLHLINDKIYYKISLTTAVNSSYSRQDLMRDTANFNILLSSPIIYFRNEFEKSSVSTSIILNNKINARHNIKTGFIGKRLMFMLSDSLFNRSLKVMEERTEYNGSSYQIQAFSQWKYKITDIITMNTGLHYHQFVFNNSVSLEPRWGLKIKFAKKQTIGFGYGFHSRLQPVYLYFQKFITPSGQQLLYNKNLGFTRSHHFVVGYDFSINRMLRLKLETYYQLLVDVPVDKDSATSFSLLNEGINFKFITPEGQLINKGEGKNYGIELTLEKYYGKKYFFLITGSLFDSKYKGSDGIERNVNFNGNYSINLLLGKEYSLSKKNQSTIGFGIKTTYAGGNRYTPFDVTKSHFFDIAYIDSLANTGQFKPYFRTDIKVSFTKNSQKILHEIAVDLVNIFNTNNTLTRTYNPFTKQAVDEQQLGFLPLFYYKIDF